jgi:hypothetical protein
MDIDCPWTIKFLCDFMEIVHKTWTLSITHGQFIQKIFLLNFNDECPWTIRSQPVIPNNNKVQDFIYSNQLEVKKTPNKRGRKSKNATNNVQTIINPAFCILSNIVIKLF